MDNIINNSLKNIKNIMQLHNGKASNTELTQYDLVNDNLSPEALKLILVNAPSEIIHLDCQYKFKYLGNKISMDQVITNLIQNAIYQIRQNGSGEIFISTEEGDTGNILRIMYTAGGADALVVDNMFKQYFTTKGKNGNGVGLAFCKTVMQSFGGYITANSKYGEYIEFVLMFPKI